MSMSDCDFPAAMRECRRGVALTMQPADYRDDLIPMCAAIEIKHDGMAAIYDPRIGHVRTLNGLPIKAAGACVRALHEIAMSQAKLTTNGEACVLQGEFTAGTLDETLSAHRSGSEAGGGVIVFDMVPVGIYDGLRPSLPWHARREMLVAAMDGYEFVVDGVLLSAVRFTDRPTSEEIEDYAGAVWENGGEGIVVKNVFSPFVRGRSRHWLRLKRTWSVDVPIEQVYAAGGMITSITVKLASGVIVGVATGAEPIGKYVRGMIVEVKHLGVTARGSLRSPSLVRVRDDKPTGEI